MPFQFQDFTQLDSFQESQVSLFQPQYDETFNEHITYNVNTDEEEASEQFHSDLKVYDLKHTSPLFESLCHQETTLDNLQCGSAKDATYRTTYTAIRKLNQFWNEHQFDELSEPTLCAIRTRFSSYVDGFASLCSMTHGERNVVLSHWVAKVVSNGSTESMKGCTKRGYLNSVMRALKMFEVQNGILNIFVAMTAV